MKMEWTHTNSTYKFMFRARQGMFVLAHHLFDRQQLYVCGVNFRWGIP
jgi:hypothetical protein